MLENHFNGIVSYDYDVEYSCEESGCCSEGICRCGRIYDEHIISPCVSELTNFFYSKMIDISKAGKRNNKINSIFYGGEEIDKYFINRILTKYKLYDPDVWSIDIVAGYYGDEIGDVRLNNTTFEIVVDACERVLNFDNLSDKVKFILTVEYGYLLNDLSKCDFESIEIDKSEIDFKDLNQNHIQNIEKSLPLIYYDENHYKLHRGVVRKSGDKYKIIDGYHRILSTNAKFKVFSTI